MARKPVRAHEPAHTRSDLPQRAHSSRARTEVEFEEATILGALFGQFDANLVLIENRLGVYIAARGNRIQIEGEAEAGSLRQMRITGHDGVRAVAVLA